MSEKHQPGFMPWDRSGNRVIVQASLGKNKPTNYQIPDQKHVYGDQTPQDPEHADLLMYKWKYHENSANFNANKHKDFIKTNKDCLQGLLSTARQFSGFRKTSQSFVNPKQGTKYMKMLLPDSQFSYGKPLPTQDPMRLVIANQYGELDKYSRHTDYKNQTWRQYEQKQKRLSFHKTKNFFLMKNTASTRRSSFDWNQQKCKQKASNQWKLQQFSNIPAKTQPPRQRELTPQQAQKILAMI